MKITDLGYLEGGRLANNGSYVYNMRPEFL